MGQGRYNGVDAVIAIIAALAENGGAMRTSALARGTGIARSTLHRIARMLAEQGILTLSHGTISVSDAAESMIARHREGHRSPPGPNAAGSPLWRRRVDPTTPLALSPPPVVRRSGGYRLGFSNAAIDNHWRVALVHGIEHAAAQARERVSWLDVRHADGDGELQAADIRALVADGIDGLLVSAVASPAVCEAIEWAMARDVAVVLVDRGLPDEVSRTSFVAADDAFIGRVTALWLAEMLGGKGDLLMLPGLKGASPAERRLEAALRVFADHPGITIRKLAWTGWREDRAYHIVRRQLRGNAGRIDGVWCDSGLQGVGSLRAFRDMGFAPGTLPPHTGGDLNLAYKLAIRLKVPLIAVDYPPAMGGRAVELLLAALQGQWVPRSVTIPSDIIVTRDARTRSIDPDQWIEDQVRWDLPDELVLSAGLGRAYNPQAFRVHYPGNVYNRSAARRRS